MSISGVKCSCTTLYRIEGDKLAENWVFIDMLHYLKLRGLDVLKRMQLLNSLGDE